MALCQVPDCEHEAEHEICRPHWRRVPGAIKRKVVLLGTTGVPAYVDLIAEAIEAVRHMRNVV